MKLLGMEFIDLAIVVENCLIICDIHLGIEESIAKRGVMIPKFHLKDVVDRLKNIVRRSGRKRFDGIIINGDVKHEFGTISDEEWRNTLKFLDFLSIYSDKIILVKGNHDTILGPIAQKKNVRLVNTIRLGDVLICHGDDIPDEKEFVGIKTIIIGHEHPAVAIKEEPKSERFKCYLVGKYKERNLVVQPSMNLLTEGTAVNDEKLLSPFLDDISDFKVIVAGDRLYDFGKLGKLM